MGTQHPEAVTARRMPPWGAHPGIGTFDNDPSLRDDEIATIVRWVEGGAPKGDAPIPSPPAYDNEWRIGTPDLVVGMDEAFELPATGIVEYQYFRVPTGLTEDRWVEAVEIRPGDPRVVHHLRVFAQAGIDSDSTVRGSLMDEVCGDLNHP